MLVALKRDRERVKGRLWEEDECLVVTCKDATRRGRGKRRPEVDKGSHVDYVMLHALCQPEYSPYDL